MLRLCISMAVVVCLACVGHAQDDSNKPASDPTLKTTKQQASYGLGLMIGKNLKDDGLEVDLTLLTRGLKDALSGADPKLTEDEINVAVRAFQTAMRKQRAEKHKREGEAFLAANKKKDGVVTLESGLQYKVLKKGDGATPKLNDTVRTHYHGTLINGDVFDSSVKRGEPISFPVGGVIRGWTEALQLMKVGSKWQLFVPSSLAYGAQGRPGIAPNATLIFEVELLGIE